MYLIRKQLKKLQNIYVFYIKLYLIIYCPAFYVNYYLSILFYMKFARYTDCMQDSTHTLQFYMVETALFVLICHICNICINHTL